MKRKIHNFFTLIAVCCILYSFGLAGSLESGHIDEIECMEHGIVVVGIIIVAVLGEMVTEE